MPRFLYYVENSRVTVATPEFRDGLGLSHIAEDGDQVESRQCLGPSGNGLIFARRAKGDGALKYDAEAQEWHKCDGGKWWLGVVKGETPGPDDLKRDDGPGGHPVKMGDGRVWLAPVITAMPAAFGLVDGQIVATNDDRFASLRDDADRVYQRTMADAAVQGGMEPNTDTEPITPEECFDIACRSLAHNYRVSRWELACIQAIKTDNMASVLEALIDLPAIIELSKSMSKKNGSNNTPDVSGMTSGSEGSPPDTSQPTQTST